MSVIVVHDQVIYSDSKQVLEGTNSTVWSPKYDEFLGVYCFYLGTRTNKRSELWTLQGLPLGIVLFEALMYYKNSLPQYSTTSAVKMLNSIAFDTVGACKHCEGTVLAVGKNVIYSNGERILLAKKKQTMVFGWGQSVIPMLIDSGMSAEAAIWEFSKTCNMVGGKITRLSPKDDHVFTKFSTSTLGRLAFISLTGSMYNKVDIFDELMDLLKKEGGEPGVEAFYFNAGRLVNKYFREGM